MKISVLISIYYKEKVEYLKQSMESVLNQTLKPNQIVIIKDGKLTQELDKELEEYKNKFPDLIDIYALEKNQGLGAALKFGVEKCKYEYIARMDTDDISCLDRFEKQIKFFKENPTIDILGGYIEEYDENMENIVSIRKVPLKPEEIKKYVKTQSPFNHTTVMMKKQAILKAGNYDDVMLEDYDLWARMLVNGCNMANTDCILGKFRTSSDMYKRRSGIKQIKKIIQIQNRLFKYRIINVFEYGFNVVARTSVAVLPISVKKMVYQRFIRNK